MKSSVITQETLESSLCQYIKKNIVDEKIAVEPETQFSAIKMDSLSLVELVLFIERQHGIIIPENDLIPENLKSARTLARCAIRNLPA